MVSRLKIKGYSKSIISQVIKQLKEYNYLNDRDFSLAYADSCLCKNWGPRRIDFKLKELGIKSDLRKQVLSKINYQEKIKEVVKNKIESLGKFNLSKELILKKTVQYLTVKGFYSQQILKECQEFIANNEIFYEDE
tara:strand:- start:317 stop:724 length:408 start_codon:yes stop_codon:yes gene_type:complete